MQEASRTNVRRRHVFFVGGYDPAPTDEHLRIFSRELARFGSVWNVATSCDPPPPAPTATGGAWTLSAAGPDWRAEATYEILAWDDLVRADMGRGALSHLRGSIRAVGDMIASGTLWRYMRISRRYSIFFLFTYVIVTGFWLLAALLGGGAGWLAAPALGSSGALLLAVAVTSGAGIGLFAWFGRVFRLKQSLDLAEFSVDFVNGRHPEVDTRITRFAERLRQVEAEGGVDEIVIAGHSLGATHAVSIVAEALRQDPGFGATVPVRILTIGSTTAKFALHPAGARLRAAADRVAAASRIGWLEIQARDDIVSFYKVNPVTLGPATLMQGNLTPGDYSQRPLIRHLGVYDMLTPETYARYRFNVMRRHCQFFLANDRRAPYDFFAFVAGPERFDTLAAYESGLVIFLAEDGSRTGPATRAPPPGADASL